MIKGIKVFNGPRVKTRLCTVSLVGILLTVPLFGCSSSKDTKNDKDSVLVNFGDCTYSFETESANRWSSGFVDFTLADGSKLQTNEMNIITYNSNSPVMNSVLEDSNVLDVETVYTTEDLEDVDMMLLLVDGEVYSLGIKKANRWSEGLVNVTLLDDSEIEVNEKNVIFYNSNSKIMDQVEEHIKTRNLTK